MKLQPCFAERKWQVVAMLFLLDGIGMILAGAIGAWSGGLITIAAVVSGYNLIFGLFYCGRAALKVGTSLRSMFAPIMSTFGIGVIAVIACFLLDKLGILDITSLWQAALLLVFYIGVYVGLTKFFLQESFSDVMNLALRPIHALTR